MLYLKKPSSVDQSVVFNEVFSLFWRADMALIVRCNI